MLILFTLLCIFFPDWVARNVFDKPDVKLEFDPGLWWWFKRRVWITIQSSASKAHTKLNKSMMISAKLTNEKLGIEPWTYHGVPFEKIYIAKDMPYFEKSWKKSFLLNTTSIGFKYFSISQADLPQIPSDHNDFLKLIHPQQYSELIPTFKLPRAISDNLDDDLTAALSLEGVCAEYISYNSKTGYYEIDLLFYKDYPVKEGLENVGAKAILEYNAYSKKMKTQSIEYFSKRDDKNIVAYPNDNNWKKAQDIMMAALQFDITVLHHTIYDHLIIGGTFCSVNNDYLSVDHPLRRLMHAHGLTTLSINILEIELLLSNEYSFVPLAYSYTFETIRDKICPDVERLFKIKSLDLIHNLESRNMHQKRFTDKYPQRDNALELHEIISKYVSNYIDAYYIDDKAITDDKEIEIKNWYEALNTYIPNGIYGYVNTSDNITKDDVKKLITLFIYIVSAAHDHHSSLAFNYLIWLHYLPTMVRFDGKIAPISVGQLAANTILLANSSEPEATAITNDISSFALNDNKGIKHMKQFREDLLTYQKQLENNIKEKSKINQDISLYIANPSRTPMSIQS